MYRKAICTLALLVTSTAISAQALTASQIVEREVIVHNADGTQTVKREAADKVTPGDKVIYSLNYFNDEEAPAENIVLVMPIPTEVTYLDGSADTSGTTTTFSVDDGKTFAGRDDLRVVQANGNERSARSEDITHIRWVINTPVAPETGGTLSFSGRLQ